MVCELDLNFKNMLKNISRRVLEEAKQERAPSKAAFADSLCISVWPRAAWMEGQPTGQPKAVQLKAMVWRHGPLANQILPPPWPASHIQAPVSFREL